MPDAKRTDMDIASDFAEMLNRSNKSLFAQGRWVPTDENVLHLTLDKHQTAELVFDEEGNLVSVTEI